MRWLIFIILLYVAAGLTQAHLFGLPHTGTFLTSPRIEYILILVIFYSLFGDEWQAPLAALAAGFVRDLVSTNDVLGTSAMAMALMSLAIVRIRMSIFREQFFSQMLITFLAIMLFAILTGLFYFITPDPVVPAMNAAGNPTQQEVGRMGFFTYLGYMTGNAIYTGIVSPAFIWLFLKMRGVMGIAAQTKRSR